MWNKNFIMILVGQIISLFGNGILRFALPLYLLNETGSAALFGTVSACAFIPMIVLGPVGGIFADRVNKRNIMVILDFSTAILVLGIIVLLGRMNLVVLLLCAMFILYGINGAYQPAVQASIPALLKDNDIMKGNAAINLVASLAGLVGPVLGGMLFGFYGISPILYVSMGCFLVSAIMEMFIVIPFEKKEAEGNIFAIGLSDLKESMHYIRNDDPLIMTFALAVGVINMVLSALIIIGLPVVITQMLGFDGDTANTLYGYSEGVYAVGSLCGGMGAGMLAGKLKTEKGYLLLLLCGLTVVPIGLSLMTGMFGMPAFIIIMASCFLMACLATLFSIQIISYLQIIVPMDLLGKVMACVSCIGMCASPLGQAVYGWLFQFLGENVYVLFFAAAAATVALAVYLKKPFEQLAKMLDGNFTINVK
ncbi:MAG: MFS transporter [Eubacteriaceae bacterium]|nr:MFS transporter [Eubacteriaceae bacterium]